MKQYQAGHGQQSQTRICQEICQANSHKTVCESVAIVCTNEVRQIKKYRKQVDFLEIWML